MNVMAGALSVLVAVLLTPDGAVANPPPAYVPTRNLPDVTIGFGLKLNETGPIATAVSPRDPRRLLVRRRREAALDARLLGLPDLRQQQSRRELAADRSPAVPATDRRLLSRLSRHPTALYQ